MLGQPRSGNVALLLLGAGLGSRGDPESLGFRV